MTASVPTVQTSAAVAAHLPADGSTATPAHLVGRVRTGVVAVAGTVVDLLATAALAGLDDGKAEPRTVSTAAIAGRPDPRTTRSVTFPAHRA